MKRLAWLLPLAFVLMWGSVLLQSGRPATTARTKPSAAEPEDEAAPAEPVAVAPAAVAEEPPPPAVPARAVRTDEVVVRESGIQAVRVADGRPLGAQRVGASAARPVAQSAAVAIRAAKAEASTEELLGEHGAGVATPEFIKLETDYTSEPRDGAWANAEEQRIASLIQKHPISKQLALLNCQDSVCRIMLETKSNDAFEQLLEVPGLAEATGLSASSPYSLRSGQLSVYYRRDANASASKTAR